MIKKRYIVLSILGILFYGLFFYEPAINESDAKKFMTIEVTDNNVDIDIAEALDIHVNQDGENEDATINIADALKIKNSGEQSAVNVLGVGSKIKESEPVKENGITKSEVSIKSDNPLGLRAGNTLEKENIVLIDGIGIGELYELNGQELHVNGIKNIIKIDGSCGHVYVNGIASIVRLDGATSVEVNGIGNRVYVDGKLVSDNIKKNGILNFVYHD